MSHQQMQPEGQMICSLINSLDIEEREVNYKILPDLLMEKHHVWIYLFIMDQFGVFFFCFMMYISHFASFQ